MCIRLMDSWSVLSQNYVITVRSCAITVARVAAILLSISKNIIGRDRPHIIQHGAVVVILSSSLIVAQDDLVMRGQKWRKKHGKRSGRIKTPFVAQLLLYYLYQDIASRL